MARVWEAFLTERDKQHVARSPVQQGGFGTRPAVLLIDNYRTVIGDRPRPLLEAIEEWPRSTGEEGWQALEHIGRLLAAARTAGVPVVHLTGLSEHESGVVSWTARRRGPRYPDGPRGRVDRDQLLQEARRHEIVEQAAPIDGEAVIKKSAPSAFFGTPLASHLRALDVDTLLVGGESTSGCVRASVVDAVSHSYRVIVVEDCVYDRHQAAHAINLFDMDRKYADVLSLDEVLRWLGGVTTRTRSGLSELAGEGKRRA